MTDLNITSFSSSVEQITGISTALLSLSSVYDLPEPVTALIHDLVHFHDALDLELISICKFTPEALAEAP